jgi:hypothetical protein
MKSGPSCRLSFLLLVALLPCGVAAQNPGDGAKASTRAAIEGIAVQEPGGEPVKKVVIELIAENQAEGGDYTTVTDVAGTFRIEGIVPGRYHLFAERTGFLEFEKHHAIPQGRILSLGAGQQLKDLQIGLQAAAVVRGRVTDEDGEPLANAQVSVLRETYASGHNRWEQVGSERSNDLGEYRVAGLAAGNYYVSANPPPDFKSLIEAAGKSEPGAAGAPSKPAMSYQTTYYPGTADRGQAAPIRLHAGDDFPVNFSLAPSPALSIRGTVVNLPPRSSAVIMLQSRDFNMVLSGAEMHQDGSFVIHDVAPGSYTIMATVDNAALPMMARQPLQVVSNSVEGLRLAPLPGASIRGRLRLEGKGSSGRAELSQVLLSLRPADGEDEVIGAFNAGESFSYLAHVASDGTFAWRNVPAGNYFVRLAGDNSMEADWYLKSLPGSPDAEDGSISVSGGAVVLDLVASANGGVVDGVITGQKGEPVANAVVVAVPELRLRSRLEYFRKTISDQRGHFSIRGIPPGSYSLLAWESVDGDAYYTPEFLKNFEGQATSLGVSAGDRKNLQLEAIPLPEEQP